MLNFQESGSCAGVALRDKSEREPGERKNSQGAKRREPRVMAELTRAELKGENLGKEGKGPKTKEDWGKNSK